MKISKEENFKVLIDRIKRLEALNTLSKHECIVQGVLDAIDAMNWRYMPVYLLSIT